MVRDRVFEEKLVLFRDKCVPIPVPLALMEWIARIDVIATTGPYVTT